MKIIYSLFITPTLLCVCASISMINIELERLLILDLVLFYRINLGNVRLIVGFSLIRGRFSIVKKLRWRVTDLFFRDHSWSPSYFNNNVVEKSHTIFFGSVFYPILPHKSSEIVQTLGIKSSNMVFLFSVHLTNIVFWK